MPFLTHYIDISKLDRRIPNEKKAFFTLDFQWLDATI